jgi:hypothetical protein
METIHMRAHTTPQGRLILDLPASLADADVEVTVTVQSLKGAARDELGWPIGFWHRFAGSMPGFPDIEDVNSEDVEPIV